MFPDPKGAAHTILEESVRLTELVNSLLTLSRMESGQNAPDLAPVLLGDAIADCLDRFHGLALQKGVVLSAPLWTVAWPFWGMRDCWGTCWTTW